MIQQRKFLLLKNRIEVVTFIRGDRIQWISTSVPLLLGVKGLEESEHPLDKYELKELKSIGRRGHGLKGFTTTLG